MLQDMFMQKKYRVYFTSCILISIFSLGQNRILDAGGRLSFTAQYDITQQGYLSMMFRVRQMENFTELNTRLVEISYGYKFSPYLRLSAHYALRQQLTTQNYYRNIHRYYLRLGYQYFINKYLTLHNRVILQYSTHRFITDIQDNGYKPYYRTDIRERVGVSWNISSKANVYVHNEFLYTLSNIPIEWRRNRIYLGYEKEWNDKWTMDIYFILQSSFHNSPDYHYFIIGCDWTLDL